MFLSFVLTSKLVKCIGPLEENEARTHGILVLFSTHKNIKKVCWSGHETTDQVDMALFSRHPYYTFHNLHILTYCYLAVGISKQVTKVPTVIT